MTSASYGLLWPQLSLHSDISLTFILSLNQALCWNLFLNTCLAWLTDFQTLKSKVYTASLRMNFQNDSLCFHISYTHLHKNGHGQDNQWTLFDTLSSQLSITIFCKFAAFGKIDHFPFQINLLLLAPATSVFHFPSDWYFSCKLLLTASSMHAEMPQSSVFGLFLYLNLFLSKSFTTFGYQVYSLPLIALPPTLAPPLSFRHGYLITISNLTSS